MLQLSETKLHHIRQKISQQVAFPDELSEHFDEDQAHQMLQEIQDCDSEAELRDFAAMLPRRRLNDIFGALLVMSAVTAEQTVPRVLTIVKQRITPSLSEIAWAFYQNHYPNDRMNRLLATIAQELQDREISLPHINAVAKVTKLPILDDTLPQRMAEDYLEKHSDKTSLSDYLVRLMLLPESQMTITFIAACFEHATDDMVRRDAELFLHAVQFSDKPMQKQLLSRYLRVERLEDDWEGINTRLLEIFGAPRPRKQQKIASLLGKSSDARIWDLLDTEVVDRYRNWEMMYRLLAHISFSNRKKIFYKKIQPFMREISRWDDKTLVLHFDHFYLADYSEENDAIYYYDLNTYDMLSEGARVKEALHQPKEKTITARDAVLSGQKHNIVKLQLDSINLLYARDFLQEQLSHKKI